MTNDNRHVVNRKVIFEKCKPYTVQTIQTWRKNFKGELVRKFSMWLRSDIIIKPTLSSLGYEGPKTFGINHNHPYYGQSSAKMIQWCLAYYEIRNVKSVLYKRTKSWGEKGSFQFEFYYLYW